jgi:hypothetical protein
MPTPATRGPRSIRFDSEVEARLARHVTRHRDLSASAAVNRFVDEALRMDEHPGIVFRDGPTGRRAGLLAGPDVWELVRALRHVRAAEPTLGQAEVVGRVAEQADTSPARVQIAIDYWAHHAGEVDAEVADAERAEDEALEAWERSRTLLAR